MFLLFSGLQLALGQGGGAQQTANKADQSLRGSGRVNPSTLGMELGVPLGAFPGRNSSLPIDINYSSKNWRLEFQQHGLTTGGSIPRCFAVAETKFSETSASGWTSSTAQPYIEYTGQADLFNDDGFPLSDEFCDPTPPPRYNNSWVRRITVRLPNGGAHELRAEDEPKFYPSNSNCSNPNDPSCHPDNAHHPNSQNGWFYAVDGSKIKYFEDAASNTYRLWLPDGSYYDFSTLTTYRERYRLRKASQLTERNGNRTTFYNDKPTIFPNGYWKDTIDII